MIEDKIIQYTAQVIMKYCIIFSRKALKIIVTSDTIDVHAKRIKKKCKINKSTIY